MRATSTTDAPLATDADTIVVGLIEDEGIPHDLEGAPLGALVEAGEARTAFRHLAVTHAQGRRFVLVGLGRRDELDAERARRAAAAVHGRAKELGTRVLCWELPHKVDDTLAAALVEATVLAGYRFDRYKSGAGDDDDDPAGIDELIVSAHHDVAAAVHRGAVGGRAQNLARELQDTPANDLTPVALGERARELAGATSRSWGATRWPSWAWAPSWPWPRAPSRSPS